MPVWKVCGGAEVHGCVNVQGSKNAVLPIMAASILSGGETELSNCPDLLDVSASIDILRHLGCTVERDRDRIYIDSRPMTGTGIPHELMLKMRSSVMFMGAILARTGQARLSTPGGCELGSRPIDLHLKGLRELGAEISEEGGEVFCKSAGLRDAQINLDFPSVGATENIMIAACAAEGPTIITNAAREPEIVDLQGFLRSMGAQVNGAGTSMIRIDGFERRPYTHYRIMSDRIAAATYLCAAAAAGGDICVNNVNSEYIYTVSSSLREMGCGIITNQSSVRLRRDGALKAPRPIITRPYPGFPTDAQALVMAATLKAEGTAVFVENIFENRYRHVCELRRMGAEIRTEGRVSMVTGVDRLYGAPVTATDLRGGAALVIAALSAEGETTIFDSGHILRGYEAFDTALQGIGAQITKE